MAVELSVQEQGIIFQMLENYVADLRMEIVDTDNSFFREGLRDRKVKPRITLTQV